MKTYVLVLVFVAVFLIAFYVKVKADFELKFSGVNFDNGVVLIFSLYSPLPFNVTINGIKVIVKNKQGQTLGTYNGQDSSKLIAKADNILTFKADWLEAIYSGTIAANGGLIELVVNTKIGNIRSEHEIKPML